MKLDRSVHADDAAFMKYVPLVSALLDQAGCGSCCDYDDLAYHRTRTLSAEVGPSDRELPIADLVISIDALDDLTPPEMDVSLNEIAAMADRLALVVVRRTVANAAAGDPVRWLLEKLGARFDLVHFQDCEKGFLVLACPAGQYGRLNAEIDFAALARTVAELAPAEPGNRKIARLAGAAKQALEVKWLALWDPRTGWGVKALAVGAVVLALSPIDLTPDVVPHLRYLDDLAVLALGTILTARFLSPEVIADVRFHLASTDHARAVRGSFAIASIWVGAVLVTLLHAMRPVI